MIESNFSDLLLVVIDSKIMTEHPNNTLENDHLQLNESEKMNIFLQK